MSGFFLIFFLIGIGWFWLDSSRARELAVEICRQASEKYGVQFLDESVELRKLGIRWPDQGIRLRRVYSFDFTRNGEERLSGKIALTGIQLEFLDFDFSIIDVNAPGQAENGNIIPIRKNTFNKDR